MAKTADADDDHAVACFEIAKAAAAMAPIADVVISKAPRPPIMC